MDKLKELINLKLAPPKAKNGITRKTQKFEIIDMQNTIFKDDLFVSQNSDTNIILKLSTPAKYLKVVANISSEKQKAQAQVFYRTEDKNFMEENSIRFNVNETSVQYMVSDKPITHIRLDAINANGGFDINYFEVLKISESEYRLSQKLNTINKIRTKIKQNPKLIKKFVKSVHNEGMRRAIAKVKESLHKDTISDTSTYRYIAPKLADAIKEEMQNFRQKPLISIIMPVYNVDPKWLDLAIKSIENQWYENWELCIADDRSTKKETIQYLKNINNPKIKIKFLEKNLNISGASNEALSLASGEFVALMDNDDEITPDALYEVVKVINETGAEFIYSDEDFMTTSNKCVNPYFKPNFSPDLLLSHNYITHFTAFKKKLLLQIGNFNSEFDGAQDYDLFLRLTETTQKIYHISKVLYHWRMIETSTSCNSEVKPEALIRGQKVLENTMKRRGIKAKIENGNLNHFFRVKYDILNNPLVSIIIPFKDKPELLTMCIESILNKTTYENFEIIGISNNSVEQSTFEETKRLEKLDPRIKFYEYNVSFNYSQINNYAVNNYSKGEHVILLNNDIEIITPDWIESMLEHSQKKEVGCVGTKLYYPNDTVQHAGVIIGLGGYAGHSHKMFNRNDYGYFNRLNVVQNVSAVTAACLMIKKSLYQKMNGLDEINFKVAYNDVDFCLRILESGYFNVFTPFAEAYHHESISRGYENTPEKIARFQKEKDALFNRHKNILEKGDPYYNPNLTLNREDFSLR